MGKSESLKKLSLTIAVPTFNRVDKLVSQVEALLRQIQSDDVILISDNCTVGFDPGEFPAFSDSRVVVRKNKTNIGAGANIIRCFELCETTWMWLLSDDDAVKPDAVNVIKDAISRNDKVCYINFKSMGVSREVSNSCCGLNEFLSKNDGFGNTLLISNNVFNLDKICSYLKYAYVSIWTNAPHIAPVIKAMEDGGCALYSECEVVDWCAPSLDDNWTIVSVCNMIHLTTVLDNGSLVGQLRKLVAESLPSPKFLIFQLSYMAVHYGDRKRISEYAKSILSFYTFDVGLVLAVNARFWLALARFPRLIVWLGEGVCYALRGRGLSTFVQRRKFSFYM